MFAVLAAIVASFAYGGFDWIREWFAWLIILLCALFPIPFARPMWHTAGADWYRKHKQFVKTYELISVRVTAQGPKLGFDLVDRAKRTVLVHMDDIQRNRAVWDLVYNGILHSVANGAEVNSRAVEWLQLDDLMARREHKDTSQE